jgi:PKD repeat protein
MKKWIIVLIIFLLSIAVVMAEPPKISLVVKPVEGEAPLTVMISEESGDPTIIDWSWDFGDGNRAFKDNKLEHIYERAGEYKLICTVINDKGEETSDSITVVVKEPTVTIEPTPTIEPKQNINTTYKTVWQGTTPIADTFAVKAAEKSKTVLDQYEKSAILSTATDTALKAEKYPIDISKDSKTIVTIEKYRCTSDICGYWITATRDGQEVATNSPVWISPPPYVIIVSESFDSVKNEVTVTVKEDPKAALEQILQKYVNQQPLGKAVIGTPA